MISQLLSPHPHISLWHSSCIAGYLLLSLSGCFVTTGTASGVVRTDEKSTAGGDLSGEWNDIDANMVSEQMIYECLTGAWLGNFKAQHPSKTPIVRFYPIKNRSSDRIDALFFSKQVEKRLLNSGQLEVLASMEEMGDVFQEKDLQASKYSDPVPSYGSELDADFVLNGWIVSQNESDGQGQSVKAYLVTMELIQVSTTKKVWIGEKRIRKIVTQAPYGW